MVRYLLEQGADRDKATISNHGRWTALLLAAANGHLDIAKLLMVYGADLNVRGNYGRLPSDLAATEEIKQAIRDEPRRRMDEAPGKRATEEDRHPTAATSASAQEDDDDNEPSSKKPRLDQGTTVAEETKVAEEDEDSEPSSDEDADDWVVTQIKVQR